MDEEAVDEEEKWDKKNFEGKAMVANSRKEETQTIKW